LEELNDQEAKVKKFRENVVRKKESEYNKEIQDINRKLAELTETLQKINA
jgi:hypothetical protein